MIQELGWQVVTLVGIAAASYWAHRLTVAVKGNEATESRLKKLEHQSEVSRLQGVTILEQGGILVDFQAQLADLKKRAEAVDLRKLRVG